MSEEQKFEKGQTDSPHQKLFESVVTPVKTRVLRIGDTRRTLEYETDQAMIDVLLQIDNRRPERANLGHAAMKKGFRR